MSKQINSETGDLTMKAITLGDRPFIYAGNLSEEEFLRWLDAKINTIRFRRGIEEELHRLKEWQSKEIEKLENITEAVQLYSKLGIAHNDGRAVPHLRRGMTYLNLSPYANIDKLPFELRSGDLRHLSDNVEEQPIYEAPQSDQSAVKQDA